MANGHQFLCLREANPNKMGFVPVDNRQELPHMNIPRVGHASFALSGRIYAVGGMDGKVPKTWRKHPCDDVFFFVGVVHVNDEVFEHSGSTKELCRFFVAARFFIHQFFDFYFLCGA